MVSGIRFFRRLLVQPFEAISRQTVNGVEKRIDLSVGYFGIDTDFKHQRFIGRKSGKAGKQKGSKDQTEYWVDQQRHRDQGDNRSAIPQRLAKLFQSQSPDSRATFRPSEFRIVTVAGSVIC